MALLGLVVGMIGIDAMSGFTRFTFGIVELGDGVGIVPVAVGLFGVSEILLTARSSEREPVRPPRLRELLPSRTELRAAAAPIGRGTVLGFLIGIIPGSAHVISAFVSYALERRLSRSPERFGKGAIEGVAGPESANNAAASGALVPLLALGVPSGALPAVMLAALLIHGVTPGPLLIQNNPELFWGLIASMYVGNAVLLVLNLPMIGLFINILRIPYAYLYPLILVLCVLGVYAINQSVIDIWIMAIMGAAGYLLRKLDFETAPIVLGLILAPMLELSVRQALAMSAGDYSIFFSRPISASMLALAAAILVHALWSAFRRSAGWRARVGLEESA
jgi:putative tricarboxylic transport membrane protein